MDHSEPCGPTQAHVACKIMIAGEQCLRGPEAASQSGGALGLVTLVLCLIGSCVPASENGQAAPNGQAPSGSQCQALQSRPYLGAAPCLPISPVAHLVADDLMTMWETGPRYLCPYLPLAAFTTACGSTVPDNAAYCPLDDGINFDVNFMDRQYNSFGDFAPVVIMAHEWGHLIQERLGLFPISGPRPKQVELQADCIAGVFAAVAEQRRGIRPGEFQGAFQSLCAAGDPTQPWFDATYNPAPHGTCFERVEAFQMGYNIARTSSICNTEYAKTHNLGTSVEMAHQFCSGYDQTTSPPPMNGFQCGGVEYSCAAPGNVAGCCLGQAVQCPASAPGYCPFQGFCTATRTCDSSGVFFPCIFSGPCGP